jgi:hypothetical protein
MAWSGAVTWAVPMLESFSSRWHFGIGNQSVTMLASSSIKRLLIRPLAKAAVSVTPCRNTRAARREMIRSITRLMPSVLFAPLTACPDIGAKQWKTEAISLRGGA